MKETGILFSAPTPDQSRFLSKCVVGVGCWQWLGRLNLAGYGRFSLGGKSTTTQRAAHLLFVGPIPAGHTVDHLCRNRACANPAHLEAVPHRINLLRGQTITARAAAATQCPSGHAYDDANTKVTYRGGRACRACDNSRAIKNYVPRGKTRRRRPKLTAAEIAGIKAEITAGSTHTKIASIFNVSVSTVSRVRNL